MNETPEVAAREIVRLSVSANDVVAWVQLRPRPDKKWQRLFYGLAQHAGESGPPMLRADGQVTLRGSLEADQIDRVFEQLRADVAATNDAYQRGDSPQRRRSTRTTSNTAPETAMLHDRLDALLANRPE
jgi:hypothetical protein